MGGVTFALKVLLREIFRKNCDKTEKSAFKSSTKRNSDICTNITNVYKGKVVENFTLYKIVLGYFFPKGSLTFEIGIFDNLNLPFCSYLITSLHKSQISLVGKKC